MKYTSLAIFLIFSIPAFAKEYSKNYSFKNYDAAFNSEDYINFEMESTKAGIFTTSFTGVVKDFEIKFNLEESRLQNGIITFKVDNIDTDSEDRNEKMHGLCLEKEKYPEIRVNIPGKDLVVGEEKVVDGKISIRGKDKDLKIKIKSELAGGMLVVKGSSEVKLSELEIPDPSIFVAKVHDLVEISFKVNIKTK